MSFSKFDLDLIKSKILLSSEIEKRTKIIKKGKDLWCCCPFHEEKTPSCKINDDLGSYYCFGCGAKGDIFNIYTDLYNYSFPDAVRELCSKAGIEVPEYNFKKNFKYEKIYLILEEATKWFENNLKSSDETQNYLKTRFISQETIRTFRIGFSHNPQTTLYEFLKQKGFQDQEIIESNIVKKDDNKNFRDFFYKRIIFPISNINGKIIGFGGRVLGNTNPKYINSPESNFFKKRNILYNLNNAKTHIRKKNNMLICEGYMDVISLHENKIHTAVAPLGTALTEEQLSLSWKYASKPTIMFDGDTSGLRASYKTALMALPFLSPNKYIQFVKLPNNLDPDSYINEYSFHDFAKLLKNPISLVNFIFEQSSSTIDFNIADNKITFDKYMDDIISTIKDNKIKYFYKNEFKNLFFNKLKSKKTKSFKIDHLPKISSLYEKQIDSFIVAFLNHTKIRKEIFDLLKNSKLLSSDQIQMLNFIISSNYVKLELNEIITDNIPIEIKKNIDKCLKTSISDLFPYSRADYSDHETIKEIQESVKNLNTRLLNLKKINKSLDEFQSKLSSLSWDELLKIRSELNDEYE